MTKQIKAALIVIWLTVLQLQIFNRAPDIQAHWPLVMKVDQPTPTWAKFLSSWGQTKQMKSILTLLVLLPVLSDAQMSVRDSLWLTLKPFVGEWKGEGGGEPGQGIYERSYQFILNKRFIEIRNKSTYALTDKNPKGEVHEDIGYFSYDNARETFMLRQFHIEGFVNEFRLESISPGKKTLVFITESIENIPAGYRAKETYRLIGEDEIEETFEIAEPDKDFKVYSKVKLVRQK